MKHFIIIGTGALARNAAEELERRGQTVTFITSKASQDSFYERRDVIIGDPTDIEVLERAGARQARAVLALSTDDATNGFVILGVHELDALIPTVAALNDPTNKSRIVRTQPSMLLSMQVLGGQLLAMALMGERVDEGVLERVLEIHSELGEAPGGD